MRASKMLRADREVVLAAVQQHGLLLYLAVLAASGGRAATMAALCHASEELRA